MLSENARRAVAEGVITLEQYLAIPSYDRNTMECLFSDNGRQAVAEGIITLKQYLAIPSYYRDTMECLFSDNGRRAVAEGVITLEQYLAIPSYYRDTMEYLFSDNGRRAVAEGIITLEQYLAIPTYRSRVLMAALENVIIRDHIRNRVLTIANLLRHLFEDLGPIPGIDQEPINVNIDNINAAQSTHTVSVHKSVSESASKLFNRYTSQIKGKKLEEVIVELKKWIAELPNNSEENKVAKRGIQRITNPDYFFTDPISKVSTLQLLALAHIAIHDDNNRIGSLADAKKQIVEGLYEFKRGYNLSDTGRDTGDIQDREICLAGTFNKIMEKLAGIHPDCNIVFITKKTLSLKFPIVVKEIALNYILNNKAFIDDIKKAKNNIEVIWKGIREEVVTQIFDEFGSLFESKSDDEFINFINTGEYIEIKNIDEELEKNSKKSLKPDLNTLLKSNSNVDNDSKDNDAHAPWLINEKRNKFISILDNIINKLKEKNDNSYPKLFPQYHSEKILELIQLKNTLNNNKCTNEDIENMIKNMKENHPLVFKELFSLNSAEFIDKKLEY